MVFPHPSFYTVLAALAFLPSLFAAEIQFDFESETADSGTPPNGWTLVTTDGSPEYKVTATGQGSDGTGGSSGLAAQVSSDDFLAANLPGGYLVNNQVFDLSQNSTGNFEIYARYQ
ncbi:hypothetical protein P0Y35_02310 [Kiritimatiellaeota bacterium B1221]|nr:hypothetical protein [Kiritimatiellaeota bacterium B1221]